jgi:hypothetical protein
MKKYKVIALSVGGLGNKIHYSGAEVKAGHFPAGAADELVKKGFLKLISDEAETPAPDFNASLELTDADKAALNAAVDTNKAIDQRDPAVIPAGTLKEDYRITIEGEKVSVMDETGAKVDLNDEVDQDLNDDADEIDEEDDHTPSEIPSIDGESKVKLDPTQADGDHIKIKQFTNTKGELTGASEVKDITKPELMKELVKGGVAFNPQDSKQVLFDLWFNA